MRADVEGSAGSSRKEADVQARKRAETIGQRIAATLSTVEAIGLTRGKKEKRFSGRAHKELFAAAAARSGLDGNELLEYALAKVALEDDFADRLIARKGAIDRDIDLGI